MIRRAAVVLIVMAVLFVFAIAAMFVMIAGSLDAHVSDAVPATVAIVAVVLALPVGWVATRQALQIKGEMPSVDFGKYLVLVATSRSSVFKVRAIQVDEQGDLKTVVVATPDMTRDYAIVITQVERAGVKSIHGQAVQ